MESVPEFAFTEQTDTLKSYIFWNNKGGVGKTTLCFQLSTLYAYQHPEENVVVIDLCPQANLSTMMLGGADPKLGAPGLEVVDNVLAADVDLNGSGSIFQYFYRVSQNFNNPAPVDLSPFLITPGGAIPENLQLVVGSQNLSMIDHQLTILASQRSFNFTQAQCWLKIHRSLRESIEQLSQQLLEATQKPTCVFIDTNPSFTTYTAIGIASADSIIIPLKADHSSRIGMVNLLELIYGPSQMQIAFCNQAAQTHIPLPRIHLAVANQNTVYRANPSKGYAAMRSVASEVLSEFCKQRPSLFFRGYPAAPQTFSDLYIEEICDFNTLGVISPNAGVPMYCLRDHGSTQTVDGEELKVNAGQLKKVNAELLRIVSKL